MRHIEFAWPYSKKSDKAFCVYGICSFEIDVMNDQEQK